MKEKIIFSPFTTYLQNACPKIRFHNGVAINKKSINYDKSESNATQLLNK